MLKSRVKWEKMGVSEMAFPKSKIISASRFSQIMKESSESRERFCFILGSGASAESGIPTGSTLEMQWMDCLMGKMGDRGMPPMDADETRKIAAELFKEKAVEYEFGEIEKAWLRAKKESIPIPSKYYFDIYKLRFHGNPRQGYNYLEKIMELCAPSLGYHTLAMLLTESSQHNLVITTNFDSLVEDALFLYTNKRPLVVSHESLADYMEANIQRPIVAKVHRGLMYAPFNSPETTQGLKPEWQSALRRAFDIYTPVVIGYAGGDHSLMSFLQQKTTSMRNGVYWCYRGKPDPANLPDGAIQKFVKDRDGYFVAIDGFDALMVELGKTMYGDAIRPRHTEEKLKKTHDERVRKYNEQWDQLNENPEAKEALQLMNAAEQKEAEQREKEKSLTAQDYFRRGYRATHEGHKENAVKEYTEAIRLDPDYVHAYNNRGNLYRSFGEREKALKDYNKAIELNPQYAQGYNNRGILYWDLKEHEKAFKDYNKAMELDPLYADPYNNRGNLYKDLGELEKALQDYNKAIELNPAYAVAYRNRGLLYVELEELDKAVEDYTQAIQQDPKYKRAYLSRANAYDALGQKELAEADRKTAAEL